LNHQKSQEFGGSLCRRWRRNQPDPRTCDSPLWGRESKSLAIDAGLRRTVQVKASSRHPEADRDRVCPGNGPTGHAKTREDRPDRHDTSPRCHTSPARHRSAGNCNVPTGLASRWARTRPRRLSSSRDVPKAVARPSRRRTSTRSRPARRKQERQAIASWW
jgi:hypothetical protein